MNKVALLFAGQGAQFVGMGKEIYESSNVGRQIFDQADSILGQKLTRVCFEGPEPELTQTSWAQPGIFVHSMAALAILQEAQPNLTFQATAGLSLGEFTALTAAKWISFEDGLKMIRRRGELMQQACEKTQGGMAAVMGIELDPLRAVCNEAGVEIANLNCPGQIVISGEKSGIEKAAALAKEKGAKRAIPLTVAGAYHSKLMKSAADELASFLSSFNFRPSEIPVISNVTAKPHEAISDKVKETLVRQVTSSVLWEESIRHILSQGFRHFIELGPGEVLAGFMKRIDKEAKIVSIGKPADLEKLTSLNFN
jgi:[acyl-carrier-protein] S-malonyltransferase